MNARDRDVLHAATIALMRCDGDAATQAEMVETPEEPGEDLGGPGRRDRPNDWDVNRKAPHRRHAGP